MGFPSQFLLVPILHSLLVGWMEEPCASFPNFCDNRQFHVIYCVSSRLCTLFRRIFDSQFTWIHDFEER